MPELKSLWSFKFFFSIAFKTWASDQNVELLSVWNSGTSDHNIEHLDVCIQELLIIQNFVFLKCFQCMSFWSKFQWSKRWGYKYLKFTNSWSKCWTSGYLKFKSFLSKGWSSKCLKFRIFLSKKIWTLKCFKLMNFWSNWCAPEFLKIKRLWSLKILSFGVSEKGFF